MNLVEVTLTFEVDIERGVDGIPRELEELSWFRAIVRGLGVEGMTRGKIISVFPGRRELRWLGDLPSPTTGGEASGLPGGGDK